ncbi:MAG: T9SS type A sorting domain-containing protein [Ignavibacteria bacterium]|nr:T9SS type A sorting domain-containing protein [Ignavibacteria bacterium]
MTGEVDNNFAIWKYNSLGYQLMYMTYLNDGTSKGMDIVANNTGSIVYTAGYFYNSTSGNYDIQILKYQDDGLGGFLVWHREYGSSFGDDKTYGITIDADENIYVCGYVSNFDLTTDYITLKYNSAGVMIWDRKYEIPGNEVATDILVDNAHVYVMGYKDEPVSGLSGSVPTKDVMLVTYLMSNPVAVPTIVELPGSTEIPTSFIISELADNTIPPTVSKMAISGILDRIVGRSWDKNYFIAHFDRNPAGNENIVEWHTNWGGYPYDDIGTGITSDNSGNLVVTGYFRNNTNDDFGTLKFDKENGNIMWGAITYGDPLGGNDRASSVFRYGNTYAISGYSQFSSTNLFVTKKFTEMSPDILEIWSNYYEPDVSRNADWQYCTEFSTDSYILHDSSVVTFGSGWSEDVSAFAIIKYDSVGNIIYNIEQNLDRPGFTSSNVKQKTENLNFGLRQNYPNPFNPVTMITYSIPEQSFVTLKVYDILGREVAELINGQQNAGSYSERFDGSKLASGMYIYKLTAVSGNNRYEKINKMTLIK